MKRREVKPPDLPAVIVDDRAALPTALHMLATERAYAVIYVDDWPGRPGQMFVQIFVAPDHEHRRGEIEAIMRRSVEMSGCAVLEADELARIGKRGAA